MALGPQTKNIAPKRNEAHLPFWAWVYLFFAFSIFFYQFKDLAASGNLFTVSKNVGSNFSQN